MAGVQRWRSRKAAVAGSVLCFSLSLGSHPALATLLFGAIASDQAVLGLRAGGLIDYSMNDSWTSNGEQPVTSLTLESQSITQSLTGSGTFTAQNGQEVFVSVTLNGGASASGSISDGALHATADAGAGSQPLCNQFFCTQSGADANTYEDWLDTLYVAGEADVPITLQITQHVAGTITNGQAGAFPTEAYDQLDIAPSTGGTGYHNSNTFADSGGVDWTVTDTLIVFAGETLTLEHQFLLNTHVGEGSNSDSGSLAFGDTANSFIDVLTAGASIVSASGVDYATPTVNPAPEPATVALLGIGLSGLAFSRRRKR